MRICLDLSAASHQGAGIARYSLELARHLPLVAPQHEYLFFTTAGGDPGPLAHLGGEVFASPYGPRRWRLEVLLGLLLPFWRSAEGLLPPADLFHGTDHLAPRLASTSSVVTVHDLSFLLYPSYHTTLNRWNLRLSVPRCVHQAAGVIVLSQAMKKDLVRLLGTPAEKVRVVYPGVGPPFGSTQSPAERVAVLVRYGLRQPYLLFVGTLEPRKNLLTLLAAYRLLRERGSQHPLVLAGKRGWRSAAFFRALEKHPFASGIRLLGPVPEADLPALYGGAAAFVYPSRYEGFGLPVLEAMACGAPVVASRAPALAEAAGDAAVLVEAGEPGALAEVIGKVLDDAALRARLVEAGHERAALFTWENCARETLAAYEAGLLAARRQP